MSKLEYCCKCSEPTGKAGAGDDSLYTENSGPFCEECFATDQSKDALAASGGNAALTDEQIKGICITAEHAGVEEGMRVAKSYLAASAPNAALVAALQQACDLIKREVADGEHTEQYHRAQDALVAVGADL